MGSFEKILIVIDPTALKQPALERVAHLPRPLKAQLKLVICDYEPDLAIGFELAPATVAAARSSLILRHRKALDALANRSCDPRNTLRPCSGATRTCSMVSM
jgi:hypothetical protein